MKHTVLPLLIGLSLVLSAAPAGAQTTGQWNVNNSSTWFTTGSWLNSSVPNAVSATALLNNDISGGVRYASDVTQSVSVTAPGTTAQTFTLTGGTPLTNTIVVSDTTAGFVWSQARGSNTTAWTVSYNSGTNAVTITYGSALGAARAVVIGYAKAASTSVTLGNMFIGDINGSDRFDVLLNQLTFDNKTNGFSVPSQLNKIVGGADEIAGNITLNNNLMLGVRTGGDSVDANNSNFQISANIGGVGGLTKLDSGNVTLSGNNTYTGDTVIRATGGTTYVESTTGNAISSNNLFLGNTSRDGHAGFVLQLGASNQIADTTKIYFDAASGRNAYIRMFGFSDTVGGISDYTGQAVIENTESETRTAQPNSVLTVNTALASDNFFYNGFFRNKSSGGSAGAIGLTKSGAGELTLSNSNVFYSGPTTVTAGVLHLQNITGSGSMPFNPLSVNANNTGGAYNGNNAPRFRSDIANSGKVDLIATPTFNAAGVVTASNDWVFGSVVSGAGQLEKSGVSTVTLTNNNTFSGATTIKGGTLNLQTGLTGFQTNPLTTDLTTALDANPNMNNSQRLIGVYGSQPIGGGASGNGTLASTSSINLNNGTLRITNAQPRTFLEGVSSTTTQNRTVNFNNGDRINNAAPINSGGGGIQFLNANLDELPDVTYSETLGTLNLLAGKTLIATASNKVGNSTSVLTFNSLQHTIGSTVLFSGRELGDDSTNRVAFSTIPTLSGGIIGGWATIGTFQPDGSVRDIDFATYDNTIGSVRALQSYTALGGTTWSFTNSSVATIANQNVRINGGNPTFSNTTASPKQFTVTVNSLKFDDNAGRTLGVASGAAGQGTLAVRNGIIARGNNHTMSVSSLTSASPAVAYPLVSSGFANELDLWVETNRLFTINSAIVNNGTTATKFVKSGPGDVSLKASSTYTGGTTVLEGDLFMTTALQSLGAVPSEGSGYRPDYLVLDGGSLQAPAVNAPISITFNQSMGVTLGAAGGRLSTQDGITFHITSKVTGLGGLTVDSINGGAAFNDGGLVDLSGLNDFQGPVSILRGGLQLSDGTNTFTGPITMSGGTFSVLKGSAMPLKPVALVANFGSVKVGDTFTIGQLSGGANIVALPGNDGMKLIVDQNSNSTFAGTISDSSAGAAFLGLEKRGKGVLTLDQPATGASSFRGIVRIAEGTLAVDSLATRGATSSIGRGTYKAGSLDGRGTLNQGENSAGNLVIEDGAALSFIGSVGAYTNRPFTIGVGQTGAGIYANGALTAAPITWVQNALFDANFAPIPGEYNTIGFTTPNQSAVLNIGGRNNGANVFGLDLHDNGTAPLSVNKTGDGKWIMGELEIATSLPVSTLSRNNYTGKTSIYLGTLGITQNGVFGAAGGESVALIGGNLDLMNVNYTVNEGLSMQGGRLRSLVGAANAWSGGVSLDVNSTVEIAKGSSLEFRGAVTGRAALTKVGTGTLILSNNNAMLGGVNVSEGALQLDYSVNTGSKLPDGNNLNLGGGRTGGSVDVVGGTTNIIEIISSLSLGLGQNRFTRSDVNSNTKIRLNNLLDRSVGAGAALDIAADGIVQTDRLNDAAGLLGSWMTVGLSDWATNKGNAADNDIVALGSPGSVAPGYVNNTWGGSTTNTTVTSDTAVSNATTNSLRFAAAYQTTTTLTGSNIISSNGILVAPSVGENVNVITGGEIKAQDNGFGGNLYVFQNNPFGELTIHSPIVDATSPAPVTGDMYVDAVSTRFQVGNSSMTTQQRADLVKNLYAGMPVAGTNIDPGTFIGSIDYTNGKITLTQGRNAETNISVTVDSTVFANAGDTMVAGVQNRVRVRGSSTQLKAILSNLGNNQSIAGGSIPGGSTVIAVLLDDPDFPTVATLTISKNISIPAVIPGYEVTFTSRNGIAKFGAGTLIVDGDSTFTGPVNIAGGKITTDKMTPSGTASPLGTAALGAGSVVLSGGTLGYHGNNVVTNRGFTINEIGAFEVSIAGVTVDVRGNLSGGVGLSNGTLQKLGAGTLKLSRVGGESNTTTSAATPGFGGATNIGGFEVNSGTLQLAYLNTDSSDNANRFAASTASLRVAGGKIELLGLAKHIHEVDVNNNPINDPSEDRSQQLGGQFTVGLGASQIWVTGNTDTTTSFTLQDGNNPVEIVREPGGTVHFVENPNGGAANIFLALPSERKSSVLPWATYKDTSLTSRPGVNDFAAVESANNDIINADSKDLYVLSATVDDWPSNRTVSEANLPFSGTTPNSTTSVFAVRFFNPLPGTVSVLNKLVLSGGAIMVGTNVGPTTKVIQDGTLTSSYLAEDGLSSDILVHNYNPAGSFTIQSDIIDFAHEVNSSTVNTPVNVVHTGDGTTVLTGFNTYTGNTFLTGGVLRASSTNAIPGGIGATGGLSNIAFKGGVLGIESNFTRPLGTGSSGVQWLGSGGFASYNGTLDVNIGGASAPLAWNGNSFVRDGDVLVFGSDDAPGAINFLNPINLGGTARQIEVHDSLFDTDVVLLGGISGNGGSLRVLGQGTLILAGTSTHTNGTELAQGTLVGNASSFGTGPLSVGSSDRTNSGDRLTLQLTGGNVLNTLILASKNTLGITEVDVTSNTSLAGAVTIDRRVFLTPNSGRSLTIGGSITGANGALTVMDGGTVALHGAGTYGSVGSTSGANIDGAVVVRNGSLLVGHSTALGTSNVELGDRMSALALPLGAVVDRSTAGRSLLLQGGSFDSTGNGTPGATGGNGAFLFEDQSTLVVDGRTYAKADVGKIILVNGESANPERNGLYELTYDDGIVAGTADDIIGLRRIDALNNLDDLTYGSRVRVTNGSDAGKDFFLTTDQPSTLPAEDSLGRVLIDRPVYWKQETSVNPNVSLQADTAGLTVANSVDINGTIGSGTVTLGGASGLTTGSSAFSGSVTLRGSDRTVRVTSETSTGRGVSFDGVISELGGKLSLLKLGGGTVTLTGDNTFTGGTVINAGTLLVSNATGSGTGTGLVSVSNVGSAIGGIGIVSGDTSILNGAAVLPGDPSQDGGVGTLSFNGKLTFGLNPGLNPNAIFEIGGDSAFDRLLVAGQLSVDPSAMLRVLLNYVPGVVPLNGLTFDLLDWGSLSAPGSLADRLDLPALAGGLSWDTSLFDTSGTLVLTSDTTPHARFAAKSAFVREGTVTIKVAIELDSNAPSGVSIPLTVTTGTATNAVDFTVSPNPVVINAGDRTAELSVTVIDDPLAEDKVNGISKALYEAMETAVIKMGSPTGAKAGIPSSFTLNILDNDSTVIAGDLFALRNPSPANESLRGVVSNTTIHVAVGGAGNILTSTDGTTWTRAQLPVTDGLQAIASSGSLFVAVGDSGRVVTSTDGLNWIIRSNGSSIGLSDVVWTGSQFVAVGAGGATFHSPDGAAWTLANSTFNVALEGVASGASKLVAVGATGTIISSSDNGLTWNSETNSTSEALHDITFNGSIFVAVGDTGRILTSSNGSGWSALAQGSANLNAVRWDGSQFVIVGASGVVLTSSTGASWTTQTPAGNRDLFAVGKVGSNWVAMGDAGAIQTSSDATAWTRRSTGLEKAFAAVARTSDLSTAGQLVAVGAEASIATSPDGSTWTLRTAPNTVTERLNAVAGSTTTIVAVGDTGVAVKSSDGTTWTDASIGIAQNLRGIALKGTTFCAVGDSATIRTYNGSAWTAQTAPGGLVDNLNGIAASTSLFVAVGANGVIITSPDGVTWTRMVNDNTATLKSVVFTGSQFVAVGVGGTVLTSTDGAVWTRRISPIGNDLNSVAAQVGGGAQVIAVGNTGAAIYSSDSGVTWTKRDSRTSQDLLGIINKPTADATLFNRFVLVGGNGTVLTTDNVKRPAPKVFFTQLAETRLEGAGAVLIEVNCSPAPAAKVTVPFVMTGTATKTTDYLFSASPLVFNPGETVKTISITPKGDKLGPLSVPIEGDETVILTLGTPTGDNATLAAPTANTLTITNDTRTPLISASPSSAIVNTGITHQLFADGDGSGELAMQWMKGTANAVDTATTTGAKTKTLNFANIATTSGGAYKWKLSNPINTAGVFTSVAELAVVEKLATTQLKLATRNSSVTLTANAGGTATALSYRWQFNPTDNLDAGFVDMADGINYTGTGTKTLTIKTLDDGTALTNANMEEGFYRCVVKLTVSTVVIGTAKSTDFEVRIAQKPNINPPTSTVSASLPAGRVGSPYPISSGVGYSIGTGYPVPRASADVHFTPTSYSATGLPAGLTINPSTGVISGIPTAAGDFKAIKITATNAAGTTSITPCWMNIEKVPDNALGSFVGLVARAGAHNTTPLPNGTFGLGARIDIATSKDGSFSGKLVCGPVGTYSFSGKLNTTTANPTGACTITRPSKTPLALSFTLDVTNNLLTGWVTDSTIGGQIAITKGWRATLNAVTGRTGLHNSVAAIPTSLEGDAGHPTIPQGDSFFSSSVATTGVVTIVGRTADNAATTSNISSSAPLSPTGEVLVYQALYTAGNPGSLAGTVTIDSTPGVHIVAGQLSWIRTPQPTTTVLYQAGWSTPITLDVAGGLYTPPVSPEIILGARTQAGDNAQMSFFDASALDLDLGNGAYNIPSPNMAGFRINSLATFVAPTSNTAGVKLSFDATKGTFSGSFSLFDLNFGASLTRNVSYWGMVVPDTSTVANGKDGKGVGAFVVAGATKLKPSKSGRVTLEKSSAAEALFATASNGTKRVAVGTEATVLTSTDGLTWTRQQLGVLDDLRGVATDGVGFIAVGDKGRLATSADGTSWVTSSTTTVGATTDLTAVIWNVDRYIVVGASGAIRTSSDGATWVPSSTGVTTKLWNLVAASATDLVAVGDAGTILLSTDNGSTWMPQPQTNAITVNLRGVAYGTVASTGTYVAVGDAGSIYFSTDGVTWTEASQPGTAENLYGVSFGASTFVAVGDLGTVVASSSGDSWLTQTGLGAYNLKGVSLLGTQWITVGSSTSLFTSSTATSWTRRY